jgi:hypothetical protein
MASKHQVNSVGLGTINIGKDYIAGDKVMGDKITGSKVVGNNNNVTGNAIGHQYVNAQTVREIKELLDRITAADQTNNSTLIAVKAIEAIEKNPTLKERIINAGKEAGFAAIDAAVDHPAIKIVTAAIKGAIEA